MQVILQYIAWCSHLYNNTYMQTEKYIHKSLTLVTCNGGFRRARGYSTLLAATGNTKTVRDVPTHKVLSFLHFTK